MWAGPTSISYDRWPLSNTLWMKLYNGHGKYKPELSEYFQMYQYQLKGAIFCAISALGVSWRHLNHPSLLLGTIYRFHLYLHVRILLHHLAVLLPHEDGFSKVKNFILKVQITLAVMIIVLMLTKYG